MIGRKSRKLPKQQRRVGQFVHGESKTVLHNLWTEVRRRCFHRGGSNYKAYGGRGITMHKPWADDYREFAKYVRKTIGEPPAGLQLDRINNSKGYVPGNLRWATRSQQCNNTRRNRWIKFDGKRLTLSQWAVTLGLSQSTLNARFMRGWTVREALTQQKYWPGKRPHN